MGKVLAAILFVLLVGKLVSAAEIPTYHSAGLTEPLPVHNLYPPLTRFYDPLPSSALRPYRRALDIDFLQSYTSDFEIYNLPQGGLLVDMEIYSLEAVFRQALTDRTEVGLVIPLHYVYKGALDGFLRDYHSALGLPNSDRDRKPDDEFSYYYDDNRGGGWLGKPGWEFGNLALRLRRGLWTRADTAIALLAGLQLPTASRERGWGSGEPDLAVGAVYSYAGQRWFGHLEGHVIHPFAGGEGATRYRDYLRGSATLGYLLSPRWSLLSQLQGGSSPYASGLPELDKAPWMVSFGARYSPGKRWDLSLSFLEGLVQETTPDFSLNVGLHIRL